MARPVPVLSLLTRLGSLTLTRTLSANSCRFASRAVGGSWTGQNPERSDRTSFRARRSRHEETEEDRELEDVEDKLQEVVAWERKKQKTVKYHIMRRQMNPSGAPERKLTWEAMEQIRFLKQQQPEEWTVARLAEGYSVAPDVIRRILRSKFNPPPERKVRQDAAVLSKLGQEVLPSGAGPVQDKLKLPGNGAQAALPSGSREKGLVPVADGNLMIREKASASLAKNPTPVAVLPTKFTADISKDTTVAVRGENCSTDTDPIEDEETWDGHVLSEEELKEFADTENPSPVTRVGNDFIDAEGNFLYRI